MVVSPKITVKKSNGKKESFKLIPTRLALKRRNLNLKGIRPALSISKKHKPKPKDQKSFSLRSEWPAIYNQGQIGSCTANAFCSCFKYLCDNKVFEPSRLYVYYKERVLMNPHGPVTDSGAFVTEAYNWVCRNGVCGEAYWPYDVSKVNDEPPALADQDAKDHTVGSFFQIRMDNDLHNTLAWCLLQRKPVMLAFGVYASFSNVGSDGLAPVPNPQNYNDPNDPIDPFYGGHEVVIIGFDEEKRLYTIANSWGSDWGDNGFFYVPYEFIENPEITYDLSLILFSHSLYDV